MPAVVEEQPARSRRSFTAEFKRGAVALVLDEGRSMLMSLEVWGSARRTWGTGFAGSGSIVVNVPA